MSKKKTIVRDWIVVEMNHVGYEDGGIVSGTYGPYTKDEAESRATEMSSYGHYGVDFFCHQLSTRHWSDPSSRCE